VPEVPPVDMSRLVQMLVKEEDWEVNVLEMDVITA
jgi:hypothetical protein